MGVHDDVGILLSILMVVMVGEMMGERHGFRGEKGLDLGRFGLFGFLRGEVVVVEDRMLREMRDISTLNKEKTEKKTKKR